MKNVKTETEDWCGADSTDKIDQTNVSLISSRGWDMVIGQYNKGSADFLTEQAGAEDGHT